MQLNSESAIRQAIELAKIVCANPNVQVQPNKETAKDIAEFIQTLEAAFLNKN